MVSSSTNDEVEKETPKKLISRLGNEENSQQFEEESESNADDYESKDETKKLVLARPPVEENVRSTCKKNASSRFSEQDEIILLKCLKKFRIKHGPKNDWVQFHKFMERKLSTEFTKGQIYEKLRALNKKFKNNASENKKAILDGHEARLFKLSKPLWEKDVVSSSSIISSRKGKGIKRALSNADFEAEIHDQEERDHVLKKKSEKNVEKTHHINPQDYPKLHNLLNHIPLPEMLKQNWALIGSNTARKLEEQWGTILDKELDLMVEKMNFMDEVCGLIHGTNEG